MCLPGFSHDLQENAMDFISKTRKIDPGDRIIVVYPGNRCVNVQNLDRGYISYIDVRK